MHLPSPAPAQFPGWRHGSGAALARMFKLALPLVQDRVMGPQFVCQRRDAGTIRHALPRHPHKGLRVLADSFLRHLWSLSLPSVAKNSVLFCGINPQSPAVRPLGNTASSSPWKCRNRNKRRTPRGEPVWSPLAHPTYWILPRISSGGTCSHRPSPSESISTSL